MADAPAPEKTRLILKQLIIDPAQGGNNNVPALKALLLSLKNSDLNRVEIPEPLYLQVGDRKLSYRDLTLETMSPRELTAEREQEAKLYYTDIALFLYQIKTWLLTPPQFREEYVKAFDTPEFEYINGVGEERRYDDDDLLKHRRELKEVVELLLEVFDTLEPSALAAEGDYDSLEAFNHDLKVNPSLITSAWDSDLSKITEAFAQTKVGNTAISVTQLRQVVQTYNRLRVSETRVLFHWVVEALRKIVADTSLLSGKQADKPIEAILSANEITRIKTDSTLYFSEEPDELVQFAHGQEVLSETDSQRAQALKKFLVDDGVMDRLLGKKALEVPVEAAAEEASEDSGGEDDAPTKPTLIPPTQVANRIVDEATLRLYTQLNLTALVANDPQARALTALMYDQLKFELSTFRPIVLDPDSLVLERQNSAGEPEDVFLFDKETGLIISNDLLDQWIEDYINQLLSDFLAAQGDLATYTSRLLQTAQETLAAFIEEPDLDTQQPPEPFDTSSVPSNLEELVRQYQASLQQPEAIVSQAWWESLSQTDRLSLAKQLLGGEIEVIRLQNLLLSSYLGTDPGFDGLDLTKIPEEYRLLFYGEVQQLLATLDYETLLRIARDPIGARRYLITQFRTNQTLAFREKIGQFQTKFQADRQAALDQEKKQALAGLQAELNLEQLNLDQITQGMDTLLLLSRDPEVFINSLDAIKVKQYLNITLSSDPQVASRQLTQLKLYLLRYAAARRLELKVTGWAENEQELREYYGTTRALVVQWGAATTARALTTGYGHDLDLDEVEKLDKEEKALYYHEREIRITLIKELWAQLPEEQRLIYYQIDPVAQEKGEIPAGATAADLMLALDQAQKTQGKLSRLQALRARLARKSPVQNLKKAAADKAFESLAQKGLLKAAMAIPYAGQALAALQLLKKLTGLDWKDLFTVIGGLVGTAVAAIVHAIASHPLAFMLGFGGGVLGFATGGASTALAAGVGGGVAGYAAQETGMKLFSGAANTGKAITSGTFTVTQTGATIAATAGTVAFITYAAQQAAFIDPLPTLDDEGNVSRYVQVTKQAAPGVKFDEPENITYTINIQAREGYRIELLEAPTDEVTIRYNEEKNANGVTTLPNSESYTEFKDSLDDFFNEHKEIGTEPVNVGTYNLPFSNDKTGYNHANISNRFTIKFKVFDDTGTVIEESTTASAAEVICFGECPQAGRGCWPVNARVGQMPYHAGMSHGPGFVYTNDPSTSADDYVSNGSDAYDLMAPTGTNVYATFKGVVKKQSFMAGGYGNWLVLEADEGFELVYAHLSSTMFDGSGETEAEVEPGTVLGKVGSTGFSSGPHLHYEYRPDQPNARTFEDSLLKDLVPDGENTGMGDAVRTCYE